MKFSVIYSVDCSPSLSIRDFQPPNLKLWGLTEKGPAEEDCFSDYDNKLGKHRKWCAWLTRPQFDRFVDKLGLVMSPTQTMGSLGTPGADYGWAPAVCFENVYEGYPCAVLNAYVTPMPTFEPKNRQHRETDWDRVREAMLAVYGDTQYRTGRRETYKQRSRHVVDD